MMPGPFRNRTFLLHWFSLGIAQTGGFFTFVAVPWLVLGLTDGDAVAVTAVMATASLPNGFFILFGGGLADRFSPYRTLLVSRAAFVVILSVLAGLTLFSVVPLWSVYLFAAVLGTCTAVGSPAAQSVLPSILPENQLAEGNGIVMGTLQVAHMIGPVAAGWLIWASRRMLQIEEGSGDLRAIGLAMAVDVLAASIALLLLRRMRLRASERRPTQVFALIREGVAFAWRDPGIRRVLGYLVLVSFFLHGTLLAALPLYTRFHLGLFERAYGTLYALMGAGTILGAGLAVLTKPGAARLGAVVLCCDLAVGLAFAALPHVHSLWQAGLLLLLIGAGLGIVMVAGITWFQVRTPGALMGRVMSLVMFSVLGLVPISAALSGMLIASTSIEVVMTSSGGLIVACAAAGLLIPGIRGMGSLPRAVLEPEPIPAEAQPVLLSK